MSALWNWDWLL